MGTGTTALTRRPTEQEVVALWRRHPKLGGLLTALEHEGDRVPVVPDDLKAVLPLLVKDAEADLAPMSDRQMDAELTAVTAALGIGMPQSEKTEWLAVAMITLEKYPGALAAEALHDAIETCSGLRGVLAHVKTYCEDYPAKMRTRLENLRRLVEISEGRYVS